MPAPHGRPARPPGPPVGSIGPFGSEVVHDMGDDVMRVIEWRGADAATRRQLLERGFGLVFDDGLRAAISSLVDEVRRDGDAAVLRALARFDDVHITADRLRVTPEEFAHARTVVGAGVVAAIADLIDHVRRFNEHLAAQHRDWQMEMEPGLTAGEKVTPIVSAGLFVPSGKGSFPSVLGQIGTPAVVAGVPRIVVVVPPVPGTGGTVDPAVLVTAEMLGIADVFRVNGPAGVAALAFGTESIPQVAKVCGPGSPPVTLAQLEVQRFGCVSVTLLCMSESLIVADGSVDPVLLAADLLNEAEHGGDSTSVLVTWDRALLAPTQAELTRQLALLPEPRRAYAAEALGTNGGAILVGGPDEAAEVANAFAPEHLQLSVAADIETELLAALTNAGEILLGQNTPFSAGNFVIGAPAALPTNGWAKVSSGITVEAFIKKTAVARADQRALARMAPSILALAAHEGFPAHANAVTARRL